MLFEFFKKNHVDFLSTNDAPPYSRFVDFLSTIHRQGLSKTEVWTLDENDDTNNMKIAEPNLHNYYYPELFIVDSDFCTKK